MVLTNEQVALLQYFLYSFASVLVTSHLIVAKFYNFPYLYAVYQCELTNHSGLSYTFGFVEVEVNMEL